MPDNPTRPDPAVAPAALGLTSEVRADGISAAEIIATVATIVWLGLAALFLLVPAPASPLPSTLTATPALGTVAGLSGLIVTLIAVVVPVALIWVAAAAARSARIMRHESRRLQAVVEQMRQAWLTDRQARGAVAQGATVERKLAEIAQSARAPEVPLGSFATSRDARARGGGLTRGVTRPGDDQPSLALGTTADELTPPLITSDLIRALNFPDTEQDAAGFAALRRALRDRRARQLVQASQDVLTLLSQDGIYMDDLTPDRARPEIWRRFATGERGRAVAALGGVRDRSCLALTMGRMRQDTIFRDAAHHFLRLFDRMLTGFEPEASDEDIARLAETRTARAFMLIGRVTGAFD